MTDKQPAAANGIDRASAGAVCPAGADPHDEGLSQLQLALHGGLSAARKAALHQRLLARATHSADRHRGYHTVHHAQAGWQALGHGLRRRLLRESGGLRAELLQLQTGACLPAAGDTLAREVLVVQGGLQQGPALQPATQPAVLGPQGYLVHQPGDAAPAWQAGAPTTLFVRSWLAGSQLPPLEARWWQLACRQPVQLAAGRRPWVPAGPGVQVQALCGDPQVVSMLVRFAPGAGVPDHGHAIDEDCLMLSGEMYLGDVLLRPLDYQLAPAGMDHFGEMSEAGGLFYFHGALDPVLLQPPG